MHTQKLLVSAVALASTAFAWAQEDTAENQNQVIEELLIIGQQKSYGNNAVTQSMMDQHSSLTSVVDVIDNIPGVLVTEGDSFGADDWSTTVSIRGFQLNLDQQQIGMTIDGVPNGNSNYGGGSKANRFIDSEDLAGVEVSQGTADISSRSHEALGGTLNYLTSNPADEFGFTLSTAVGEYDAKKVYARLDTGEFAPNTSAWISVSKSESSDFMEGSAENEREHVSAKIVSAQEFVTVTGFVSYDDAHEDNYQRITVAEFDVNEKSDRLIGTWTGIPYVDQVYRKGWSTLRENTLGYLKVEFENDGFSANATGYYHHNNGRGDWLPPYVVAADGSLVTYVDNTGAPISYFAADGTEVVSIPGCESTLTFPYGGGSAAFDPSCQDTSNGAIPVGSYRHTHYTKTRTGLTADIAWAAQFGEVANTLRGGLWYEDYLREESRNWHQITDSRLGYSFEGSPYWLQYDNEFPVTTAMYYLEDSIEMAGVTVRLGAKKFFVELDKDNELTGAGGPEVDSDSDVLPSFGVVYNTPVDGLEVFFGYAENFAAIKDVVLESADAVANVEAETAKNTNVGIRFQNDKFQVSAVYYDIEFDNRIQFVDGGNDVVSGGSDYLGEVAGQYINQGGIESNGLELAFSYNINENFSFYSAYTYNDSTYLGTGDSAVDTALGINPGNTVIGSPDNMLVLSLDFTMSNYYAGVSQKWVDERFVTADNSSANIAPDYSLFDVYAGTDIALNSSFIESLNVHLTVNNLLDENYLSGISGDWGAWVGAPRTAVLGLTAKF